MGPQEKDLLVLFWEREEDSSHLRILPYLQAKTRPDLHGLIIDLHTGTWRFAPDKIVVDDPGIGIFYRIGYYKDFRNICLWPKSQRTGPIWVFIRSADFQLNDLIKIIEDTARSLERNKTDLTPKMPTN